jgi:hypothetical protein
LASLRFFKAPKRLVDATAMRRQAGAPRNADAGRDRLPTSTNMLERLNQELKRRSWNLRVIPKWTHLKSTRKRPWTMAALGRLAWTLRYSPLQNLTHATSKSRTSRMPSNLLEQA